VNGSVPELVEHSGQASGDASDPDARMRLVLAVAQPLRAISEQRRASLTKKQLAPIDLDQMLDHLGTRSAFFSNQHRQALEELAIRESTESETREVRIHEIAITCGISALLEPRWLALGHLRACEVVPAPWVR